MARQSAYGFISPLPEEPILLSLFSTLWADLADLGSTENFCNFA